MYSQHVFDMLMMFLAALIVPSGVIGALSRWILGIVRTPSSPRRVA